MKRRVNLPFLCGLLASLLAAPLPLFGQAAPTAMAKTPPDSGTVPSDSLKRTAALVAARAAARQSSQATSTADSLRKTAKRDSLNRIIARCKEQNLTFPSAPDSILGISGLGPWHFLHSDAIGISEAARTIPSIVAVPFSLGSGANRFMYYGFPLLPNAVYFDNNAFPESPTSLSGTDDVFATQVTQASASGPRGLDVSVAPSGLVIPQTCLLWENGVFGENALGVRFSRPITRTIDLALSSDYLYFAPYTYVTAGDMTSLYDYFIADTSLLANGGRNPLSNETNMSLALSLHSGPWENAWISYSYEDAKNDYSMQQIDSTGLGKKPVLQWESLWRYVNIFRAQVRSIPVTPAGRLMLNADARAVWEGHTASVPNINSLVVAQEKGRNTDAGLCLEPFLPFRSDTFSVIGSAAREERLLYNGAKATVYTGDARVGYRRAFSFPRLQVSVKASLGDGMLAPQGALTESDHSLVYSAEARLAVAGQTLRLFALRDHLPYVLPFDTIAAPFASYFNLYNAYGGELYLGYKKLGLSLGACGVSGIDTAAAERFWPNGVMPYQQPHVALMAAPLLGRWLGFALGSRLILSDVKPYVKSQTTLSYVAQPLGINEHITVDLMYDYWSAREAVLYGGSDLWSRELTSLSLHMTVHIAAFNIFYKVDNILDRKYAYVPGYFMPGITFRWGFAWVIQ
jgi:hypothetical protein